MSIDTIGSVQSLLKNHQTDAWTKPARVEGYLPSFSESLSEIPTGKNQSFTEILGNSIAKINSMQKEADVAVQKLVTGESKNIHETLLAVEQAEIAFKTMNQIRSKVIDAYKEIMRMQI